MSEPRISLDDDLDPHPGELDELVAHGVTVHFERMDDAAFWFSITYPDGRRWDVNCGATNPRARGYAHIEEGT